MEFNEREKSILVITTYLIAPETKAVPNDTLALGLQVLLSAKGINHSLDKISDFIDAIRLEQSETMKQGFGKLDQMKNQIGEKK